MSRLLVFLLLSSGLGFVAQDDESKEAKRANQIMLLLADERVLGDLEPTREQKSEIKRMYSEKQLAMRDLMIKSKEGKITSVALDEGLITLDKNFFSTFFYDILLDHQRDRVLQLHAQLELNSVAGSYSTFLRKKVDDELNVSPEQKEKLAEIRESKLKELYEESRKFRDKIDVIVEAERSEAIAVLSNVQKTQLLELLGEPYKGPGMKFWAATIVRNFLSDEKFDDSSDEHRSPSEGK